MSTAKALRHQTTVMGAGLFIRIAVQAAYFILIARSLGVSQYGVVIAAAAISNIIAPFATFGTGNVLIRLVACDRTKLAFAWGVSLTTTVVLGFVFAGIAWYLALFVTRGIYAYALASLILSDVMLNRIIETCAQVFQAIGRLAVSAAVQLQLSVARLFAALAFVNYTTHSVAAWSELYLGATLAATVIAVIVVARETPFAFDAGRVRPTLTEGFYFAGSLSLQTVYNDADKALLARLSGGASVGVYGSAYRIVDVAFTPYRAFIYAAYPEFFRLGADPKKSTRSFALQVASNTALYGIGSGVALFVVAGMVPTILGHSYDSSVAALRLLSPIPLFRAMHYLAADALAGAGLQRERTVAQLAVAVTNVALNWTLIPIYSWHGAAFVSLMSDGGLAVLLWLLLLRPSLLLRRVQA